MRQMRARRALRLVDGLPLIDAAKPLDVLITEDDIRHAIRKDCDLCAASLALCRDARIKDARVYLSRAYVRFVDKWVRYETGAALRRAIVHFDRAGVFEPGRYRLGAPCPTNRLGCGYAGEWARRAPSAKPRRHAGVKGKKLAGVRSHAPHLVGERVELGDDRPEHGRRAGP